MKTKTIIFIITLFCFPSITLTCENDREVGGYNWTFHRMEDGNSYHECILNKEFSEGSSLVMPAPCDDHYIDTVQVKWEDNRSEVSGELVVNPGDHRLGSRDVSSKSKESWRVQNNVKTIELIFSGKRDHRCRLNWIRMFYGSDQPQKKEAPGNKQKLQKVSKDIEEVELNDRLKTKTGAAMRKCHVETWDGNHLIIVVSENNRKTRNKYRPDEIESIEFSERWGKAVTLDNTSYLLGARRFQNNMLSFEKNIDGQIIRDKQGALDKFKSINFDD